MATLEELWTSDEDSIAKLELSEIELSVTELVLEGKVTTEEELSTADEGLLLDEESRSLLTQAERSKPQPRLMNKVLRQYKLGNGFIVRLKSLAGSE